MLQVKNIHRNENNIKIVDGISLEAAEKKITAITGPDGSGKTTLLDIIMGITKPTQGKVFFDEFNITNLSTPKRVRLGISRIFAEPKLFLQKTVLENLILAFDEPYDHFWRALFRFKLKSHIYYERKLKVDSVLNKLGLYVQGTDVVEDLSILQRKFLSLAKSLLMDSKLIIFDEISSGLDKEELSKVKKILTQLKKNGKTIVVSDQHLDFVLDVADKIVVLSAGEEIAMGTPGKIKHNKKVLEAYNK